MNNPALYLVPVTLGDTPIESVLPAVNVEIVSRLKYFIVENVRSARRFLKKCHPDIDIDSLTFFELNTHTKKEDVAGFLQPLRDGHSMGVISEAGCPAVADPGADVVAVAQRKGFRVVPMVGPSSILMALMASGFNGQSFAFHGYLPIEQSERIRKIKHLEARACDENQSQIFIETPYRNQKLAEDILQHCRPASQLCIAMNISCDDEYIVSRSMREWKNKLPEMHKKPCVFILYKG
ncbi:MAG: SAM-dependent methyltransferase [Dysgonamonadaceae bacterium]|jgi:16S rRNA (cytidine1402-2'-O)-methyltransferase|nr:SAM-dependent methyltransferase [Dysgonamonadaceae bacterium]